MAEFRINVVVDPTSAEAKINKVTDSLAAAEKVNTRLNKGLKNTFAIKTLTMAQGLERIVKSLNNIDRAGLRALKTLNRIKGFNASRVKITPQITKQQKQAPTTNPADFEKNAGRINKTLDNTIKRVDKLDKALQRAFDIKTRSAVTNIGNVNRKLRETQVQGQKVGNVLKRAFTFLATGFAVREAGNLADAYTNTQNRLKLVTKDTAELNAVTDELFRISERTRSSFESTATIYSRTALSVKALGLSQKETLEFVESLNQAIILSGVNSVEASNGLIQLSQGIASGTLRGDELRSVLEQLPAVADVISTHLGITRGELRLLGTEGKITGQIIIEAFAGASESLTNSFGKTVPTLGQSFTILKNNVIKTIGEFDKANKVTANLSAVIIGLARNLETLGKFAIIAGSALAVGLAKRGILVVVAAVHTLTAAIALNPIGALIIAVIAGVTALVQFGDEISLFSTGIISLGDLFSVLWDSFVTSVKLAISNIKFLGSIVNEVLGGVLSFLAPIGNLISNIFDGIEFSIGGVLIATARAADRFIGVWVGAFFALNELFLKFPDLVGSQMILAVNAIVGTIENMLNKIVGGINKILKKVKLDPIDLVNLGRVNDELVTGFADLGDAIKVAFLDGFDQNSIESTILGLVERARAKARERVLVDKVETADLTQKGTPETKTTVNPLTAQLDLLKQEAELLKLTSRERQIQTKLIEIANKLSKEGVEIRRADGTLNESGQLIVSQLRLNAALSDQADILNTMQGPQQDQIANMIALVSLYDKGSISLQQLNNQMLQLGIEQAAINIENNEGSFADGFIVGIERMLESVNNFGSEAGTVFAGFFDQMSTGFANSIADSIVFGNSFKDAVGTAARQALAGLLSGLIKLGVQYVLNATLANTISTATTAAAVIQATAISAAYAAPASLVSLASYGANAIPAQAGMLSTAAVGKSIAAFADGGFVSGKGGPRSDEIPAMLSNGEFVVNAKSTSRFKPQLEALNSGKGFADGGLAGETSGSISSSGDGFAQPIVNLKNINVLDPSIVGEFLATEEGEQVMLNFVSSNSEAIKGTLG